MSFTKTRPRRTPQPPNLRRNSASAPPVLQLHCAAAVEVLLGAVAPAVANGVLGAVHRTDVHVHGDRPDDVSFEFRSSFGTAPANTGACSTDRKTHLSSPEEQWIAGTDLLSTGQP